jgi:hypothetical protein
MSAVMTDEINDVIIERTNTRKKQAQKPKGSFLNMLNLGEKLDNHKLARAWGDRNHEHGDVFATSLEVDYIIFQQNLFIEETKELTAKLSRIGFEEQIDYPDEELFSKFVRVMYNRKHNIAVMLYQPKNKHAIHTAHKIVEKSIIDGQTGLAVFLAAVDVLLSK